MKFARPKGQRFHKQFRSVTNFSGLWWVPHYQKWCYYCDINGHLAQSWAPCKTVRAFRRHLRKHPEIRGKAALVSRFVGYDVYA